MYKDLFDRLIKFLIVGGICTLINYGLFYGLLNYLSVKYLISSAVGYITGLVIGYYINKFWTYKVKKNSQETFIFKYLGIYLLSLAASSLLLKILVENIYLNPSLANVFAIGLSTVTNFAGTNFLVFKNQSNTEIYDDES